MALSMEGGLLALWINSANEWDNNRGKPVPLALIAENPFKISEFHSPWPVYTYTLGLDRDERGHTRVDARRKYMYHWQYPIGKLSGRFQPLRVTVNMGDYCGPQSNALKLLTGEGTWDPLKLNIAAKSSMSLRDNILEGDVLWSWLVTPYLPEVLSQYEYHRGEEILKETRGKSRGQWYFDVKLMDGSIRTVDDQWTLTRMQIGELLMGVVCAMPQFDHPCFKFRERLPESLASFRSLFFESFVLTYSIGRWVDRLA